jgi:hypothetical protein
MGVGDMFRNNVDKELLLQSQQENRQRREKAETDLFSTTPVTDKYSTPVELPVAEIKEKDVQISDSHEVVKKEMPINIEYTEKEVLIPHSTPQVVKIVFFYSDNCFEVFYPNKK